MNKPELKDWMNSITFTKEDLLCNNMDSISSYSPYVINRCLSAHLDTILYANEMNERYNLDPDMQYKFYLNSIRKKKRFSSWNKQNNLDDLIYVKEYYNYSTSKAIQVLSILTKDQIKFIKTKLDKGGLK